MSVAPGIMYNSGSSAPGANDAGGPPQVPPAALPGILSGIGAAGRIAGQVESGVGTIHGTVPGPAPSGGSTATAKSAHEMIVATGIVIVVVYLLVIVAGISKGAGRAVLVFFGLAIIIQGLGNVGSVLTFVQSKPLTRKAG